MEPKITRRRLVAGAAGVGAGVLLLPGINARAYAANEKLNLALVGCGNRGGNLLESFLRIGEKVVALCDAKASLCSPTPPTAGPPGKPAAEVSQL